MVFVLAFTFLAERALILFPSFCQALKERYPYTHMIVWNKEHRTKTFACKQNEDKNSLVDETNH